MGRQVIDLVMAYPRANYHIVELENSHDGKRYWRAYMIGVLYTPVISKASLISNLSAPITSGCPVAARSQHISTLLVVEDERYNNMLSVARDVAAHARQMTSCRTCSKFPNPRVRTGLEASAPNK